MRLTWLALALTLSAPAVAAELFVEPVVGVNTGACLDVANPCRSVTYAMTRASDGDRVIALPGTYSKVTGEIFPIRFRRGVVVVGRDGSAATTLLNDQPVDPRSLILHFEGAAAAAATGIEGFTLDGTGHAINRYGIAVESLAVVPEGSEPQPFVRACRILGFADAAIQLITFGFNRGVAQNSLAALIERNEIRDCGTGIAIATRAQDGTTRSLDGSLVRNNVVLGCGTGISITAEWDSFSLFAPSGTGQIRSDVRHNTLLASAGDGIVLNADDARAGNGAVRVVVANNIVAASGGLGVREDRGNGSSRFLEADVSALVANVLFGNAGGDYYDLDSSQVYTGVSGPASVHGIPDLSATSFLNLDADPLVAPTTGRLLSGSPAIDAGSQGYSAADDIDGDRRPEGPAADIGADEFVSRVLRRGAFTGLAPLSPDRSLLLPALPAYLLLGASPFVDPDAGVLGDGLRPLVVYQFPAGMVGVLKMVKDLPTSSVALSY